MTIPSIVIQTKGQAAANTVLMETSGAPPFTAKSTTPNGGEMAPTVIVRRNTSQNQVESHPTV